MTTPSDPTALVYLTLITAPPGHTTEDLAQLLAGPLGLDAPTLRLRLVRPLPLILGLLPQERASDACAAVSARGGDAFAPSLAEISALGPTNKIKDLTLDDSGAIGVELWRGPACTIPAAEVEVLVRAHLVFSTIQHTPARSKVRLPYFPLASPELAIARAALQPSEPQSQHATRHSDKLDIHVRGGEVFQIDGDKFGFRVLGDQRGLADAVNMTRLLDLLLHIAPDAVSDCYFSLWQPPPGHDRLRLPHMSINNDDPAFAFYSRWSALMYRHVMGAEA